MFKFTQFVMAFGLAMPGFAQAAKVTQYTCDKGTCIVCAGSLCKTVYSPTVEITETAGYLWVNNIPWEEIGTYEIAPGAQLDQKVITMDSICDGQATKQHENGGGFVAVTAEVDPTVYVDKDSVVCDHAKVTDEARIEGQSFVGDDARVADKARVKDSTVRESAVVAGAAKIKDGAEIRGKAQLFGTVTVKGVEVESGTAASGQLLDKKKSD